MDVRDDAARRKDALERLLTGKATQNQIRREFGLPEQPDGDVLLILEKYNTGKVLDCPGL